MKKDGQITGFDQIIKPYVLRDKAVKTFNESCKYLLDVFYHLSTNVDVLI